MHSLKNSDLFYESVQGQNSSLIGNRWYPSKVRLWTRNSKQEIRPSLADCFPNHSQSFILVIFMNIQDNFHLSLLSTKHQAIFPLFLSVKYVFYIEITCLQHKKTLKLMQFEAHCQQTSGINNKIKNELEFVRYYFKNKSKKLL